MANKKTRNRRRQRSRESGTRGNSRGRSSNYIQILVYLIGGIVAFAAIGGVIALVVNNNNEQLPEIPTGDVSLVDFPIGTGVGNSIPDISLRLNDGSTVSTHSLSSEGKPAFLFFFATW